LLDGRRKSSISQAGHDWKRDMLEIALTKLFASQYRFLANPLALRVLHRRNSSRAK